MNTTSAQAHSSESVNLFDAQAFSRLIHARVTERGVTVNRVATETGIARSTMHRIAAGKSAPEVEHYLRLLKWMEPRIELAILEPRHDR